MSHWQSVRRGLIFAGGMAAFGAGAQQPARQYAVMSFLADTLTIVGQEPQTGTAIRRNTEDTMPLGNDGLDQFAMQAALRTVSRLSPGANAVALRASNPKLYATQATFIDGDKAKLPAEVLSALQEAKVTHVILLTKYRSDATFQFEGGGLGSGKVAGLGFYIDRYRRIRISGTSVVGVGYIAPFAYFELTLVDLATQSVLRTARATRSLVVSPTPEKTSAEPWDLLDSAAKMQALGALITEGVEEGVPKLLAAS